MIHILLHIVVPYIVAVILYRDRKWKVFWILMAAMLVDLDHLAADPVYDPDRCSIGFHALHTMPFIVLYGLMFLFPYLPEKIISRLVKPKTADIIHLAGLGLVIHMALDWLDCVV